jgi:diadenosine tetraphosphate (Ap4A) HIT family hydrolase
MGIMKTKSKFTSEYARKEWGRGNLWDRVLLESRSFQALPSVGAMVEGWLLIAPKKRYLSSCSMENNRISELESFMEKVGSKIENAYSGYVSFFEHGPYDKGSTTGCGVDYAHIHCVPLDFDLHKAACSWCDREEWRSFESLRDIKRDYNNDYIFIRQDIYNKKSYVKKEEFESQLLRKVIADRIGEDEHDWKKNKCISNIKSTIKSLN